MADQRPLHAQSGARGDDAFHRLLRDILAQLDGVAVMAHHGQVLARLDDALEQAQQIIRIAVGNKTLRPVRHRLGADANVLDVFQARRQQRLQVGGQLPRVHDHRVAARDQHIRHFRMQFQVGGQLMRFARIELHVVHADELGPAEAEGAIRVARLARAGEK